MKKEQSFCTQVKYLLYQLYNLINYPPDTDSFYVEFTDWSYDEVLDKLYHHLDFSNFPKDHPRFSEKNKAQFGFVKVDTSDQVIHAFIGEKKKSYSLFTNQDTNIQQLKLQRKTVKKGCPQSAAKKIKDKEIIGLLQKPKIIKTNFKTLSSHKHQIKMIHQEKTVSNSFDNSAFYKTCGLCNVPFHCTIENIEICTDINCKLMTLLVSIWNRLLQSE